MKWSCVKRSILISSVALIFAVTCGWAQTGTTSLHGVVTDKTGATIANAKVTLTNAGQALKREKLTNNVGEYDFLALPPGAYLSESREFHRQHQRAKHVPEFQQGTDIQLFERD
jgi:hypothetical protein